MKRSIETSDFEYRELSNYVSRYPKFTTNEYNSRFVIQDLGEDKMENLSKILSDIITKAYENSAKEYGNPPHFYIIFLNSDTLESPVKVTIYDRNEENDIFMAIYFLKTFY